MGADGFTKEERTCPNCSKIYRWKRGLDRHLLECGQEPKLCCPYCDYRCKRKESLTKHMNRRHGITNPSEILETLLLTL